MDQAEDCNSKISRHKMSKILRITPPKIPKRSTDAGNADVNVFDLRLHGVCQQLKEAVENDIIVDRANTSNSSELTSISPRNPSDSHTLFRERRPIDQSDLTNATPTIDSTLSLSNTVENDLKNTSKILGMSLTPSQCSSDTRSYISSPVNSNVVGISVSKEEWGPSIARNVTDETIRKVTTTPMQFLFSRSLLPSALSTESLFDDMPKVLSISFRRIDASNRVYIPTVSGPSDPSITSWLKTSENDVTKLNLSEVLSNTAPCSSLNNTIAKGYKCEHCGLPFENFESHFTHTTHQHTHEYCSDVEKCTLDFLSNEQCFSGVNTSNTTKGSTDNSQKLISNSSANLTPLNGIKAINSKSPEEDILNSSGCVSGQETKSTGEIVLNCPLCGLSSISREFILKHVLDRH
nr:hypothetical protein HmN_000012400 [Hymenolepis microstoma]